LKSFSGESGAHFSSPRRETPFLEVRDFNFQLTTPQHSQSGDGTPRRDGQD
jgi:hypothetical protein